MLYLLKLEWKKLVPNRAFWIVMAMYIVLLPLLYMTNKSGMNTTAGGQNMPHLDTMYHFPKIWDTVAYSASWLTFFLFVYLAVWMVTSEVGAKTMRQNLITGLERRQYLFGKVLMMLALTTFATAYMAMIAAFFGRMAGGYGDPFGVEIHAIHRFFVQTMFYMSFAFMLAVLSMRSGLSMIVFFAYTLIIERIVRYLVFLNILGNLKMGSYFPASAAWDLVPMYWAKEVSGIVDNQTAEIILSYNLAEGLTIAYTIIFLVIASLVFRFRDL